jgi:hypothetical protein
VPESYLIWQVAKQLGMWPGYLEWLIEEGGGSDWWLKIKRFLALEAFGVDAQQHKADRVYVRKR